MGENNFILMTAKDYDMSYAEVEKIYEQSKKGNSFYSVNFYDLLEEFIKNRKEK